MIPAVCTGWLATITWESQILIAFGLRFYRYLNGKVIFTQVSKNLKLDKQDQNALSLHRRRRRFTQTETGISLVQGAPLRLQRRPDILLNNLHIRREHGMDGFYNGRSIQRVPVKRMNVYCRWLTSLHLTLCLTLLLIWISSSEAMECAARPAMPQI